MDDESLPLRHGVCEVGYAIRPDERSNAHSDHQSSNYMMKLFESIYAKLFPLTVVLDQYVVLGWTNVLQAPLGEALVSRLGQAYTTHGGGFSHQHAGQSNESATKLPPQEWAKLYRDRAANKAFLGRIKAEIIRGKRKWKTSRLGEPNCNSTGLRYQPRKLKLADEQAALINELLDKAAATLMGIEAKKAQARKIDTEVAKLPRVKKRI
jgi:hypothetical protein